MSYKSSYYEAYQNLNYGEIIYYTTLNCKI